MEFGKKKFERGSRLAWKLSGRSGYRGSGQAEWQLVELASLEGSASGELDIVAALDLSSSAPETRLSPLSHETVQVVSDVRLVVQGPLDDDHPRVAENTAEVPYGAVCRAGALLFAPLYEEQAESLHEGLLTLPEVPEAIDILPEDSAEQIEHEVESAAKKSKASLWLVAAFVALIAIVGGLFLWHHLRGAEQELIPTRVLYAFSGWEDTRYKVLRDTVDESLRDVGLDPVLAEQSKAPVTDIRALEDEAREKLASQVLLLRAEVTKSRPGLGESMEFHFVRVSAQTHDIGQGEPNEPGSIEFGLQRLNREEALVETGRNAMEPLLAGALSELVQSKAVAAAASIATAEGVGPRHQKLLSAQAKTVAREKGITSFEEGCAETAKRLTSKGSRSLTDGCRVEHPVGMTADGSAAVIHVSSGEPYFLLETPAPDHWAKTLEHFDLVQIESGERRPIAFAEKTFGEAALSADGRKLVFVEVAGMRHGLVEVDVATAKRRVLHDVALPERLTAPQPSPDGRMVLFKQSRGQRDPGHYRVLDTESGEIIDVMGYWSSKLTWVELDLPGHEGRQTTLAVLSRLRREDQEDEDGVMRMLVDNRGRLSIGEVPARAWQVHIVAPRSGEKLAHVDIIEHRFWKVIGSRDGDLVLSTISGKTVDGVFVAEGNISTYDFEQGKLLPTVIERIPAELRQAYDGSLLGVRSMGTRRLGVGNDREIVRVDVRNGAIHRLTENPLRDMTPIPAARAPVYIYSCRPWTAGRELSVCLGTLPELEPLEEEL